MKHLQFEKQHNKAKTILRSLSLTLMIIGLYLVIKGVKYGGLLVSFAAILSLSIDYKRNFCKNVVVQGKYALILKLNKRFKQHIIKYSKFKEIQNNQGELTLIPKWDKSQKLDLSDIAPEDVQKLVKILEDNIG